MVTNYGEQPINYGAFAIFPGQARQERLVTNLGPGRTAVKRYRFAAPKAGGAGEGAGGGEGTGGDADPERRSAGAVRRGGGRRGGVVRAGNFKARDPGIPGAKHDESAGGKASGRPSAGGLGFTVQAICAAVAAASLRGRGPTETAAAQHSAPITKK